MRTTADAGSRPVLDVALPERYQLLRRIASGGMASVWFAHDLALSRRVAIKLLARRYVHDQAAVRRFKREARAAAALSGHPHVVTIFDVGETTQSEGLGGTRAFIVMEYLGGGSVADAARMRTVTRAEAIRWLHQAAAALDYAHGRGVLHRDIKLANLLLDHERVLHVADFGIAQIGTEDPITGSGEVLGTAAYLAPERALGEAATEACDRYSLAVAAYELLVGSRPFQAETFTALARQHVEEPPPAASARNRTLSQAVDSVLARGMGKDPADRWPTASEFADALERALTGPVFARPPAAASRPEPKAMPQPLGPVGYDRPAPPRPRTRPKRAKLVLAALAAGAIGVGAAAVVSNLHSGVTARKPAGARHTSIPHRRPAPRHHRTVTAPRTHSVAATSPQRTTRVTPVPRASADTLQARGHQLMLEGNYSAAIPVLRGAVASSAPGSLTYAYALFDLGRSLRLAGDPKDAAKVLWQRLQIPNQTETVRGELQLALRALGERAQGSAKRRAPGAR